MCVCDVVACEGCLMCVVCCCGYGVLGGDFGHRESHLSFVLLFCEVRKGLGWNQGLDRGSKVGR